MGYLWGTSMIINHKMVFLAIVEQKQPELWVSYPYPPFINEDKIKIATFIGDQSLKNVAKSYKIKEDEIEISTFIGNQKLISTIHTTNQLDELQVTTFIGNQTLKDIIKNGGTLYDSVSTTTFIGDQKLYNWGVRAELLDEDHIKVSTFIRNQKLYEEES